MSIPKIRVAFPPFYTQSLVKVWDETDRAFRVIEWLIVSSVTLYGAKKLNSPYLKVVSIALFLLLFRLQLRALYLDVFLYRDGTKIDNIYTRLLAGFFRIAVMGPVAYLLFLLINLIVTDVVKMQPP